MFFIIFLLLLLIFIFVDKKNVSPSLKKSIIIGLLIRLTITLIFWQSKSEDLTSFLTAGESILAKKSIYPTLYFPFFPYLGALSLVLKNLISPLIFLKMVFTVFDVLNIIVVYYLSKKNKNTALLYALNPITIICVNIHGQFDVIPLFFLMLALYLFIKQKQIASMFSISFAVFTKTWPLLFAIPLFSRLKNKYLFLLIIIFPLLSVMFHSLVFKTPLINILLPIKNYRGVYGYWGIGNILILLAPKLNPSIIQILRRVFLVSLLIFSLFQNDKNIVRGVLRVMLFFFVFTLTFGTQWLAWLVPFIILVRPKNWRLFFIFGTLYLLAAFTRNVYLIPANFIVLSNLSGTVLSFFTWLSVIYLFFHLFD